VRLHPLRYSGYQEVIEQGGSDRITVLFARWRTGSPWDSLNIVMRNRLRRAIGRMIGRRA
jgi:hypothetical protein